jgi:hypothetical protein
MTGVLATAQHSQMGRKLPPHPAAAPGAAADLSPQAGEVIVGALESVTGLHVAIIYADFCSEVLGKSIAVDVGRQEMSSRLRCLDRRACYGRSG